MLRRTVYLAIGIALIGASAWAQTPASKTPDQRDMYCSGIVTPQAPKTDGYVISGRESDVKVVYAQGDEIFINKGARQGVKVGDMFQVSRQQTEQVLEPWFAPQQSLLHAMGNYYESIANIHVISVQDKVSVAKVDLACDYVQRGDIIQPFVERPAPAYKAAAKFDTLAPVSGKPKARIVISQGFGQLIGAGKTIYVNVGISQGVKVGDYFRLFRYQGDSDESAYNVGGTAYKNYGFGSTPEPYTGADLPRDVLGEGLVLRVGPNAATILVTYSQRGIHVGDYAEIE